MGKAPPTRDVFVSVPLPEDESLPSVVRERFAGLPHLNNLRMLANVRNAFSRSWTSSTRCSTEGKVDPRLREIMYLRIAANYRLLYEYRHNLLFAQQLGMSDQ